MKIPFVIPFLFSATLSAVTPIGHSIAGLQSERVRVVVADGKQPLQTLVQPADELLIVESPRSPNLHGELKSEKSLLQEITELDMAGDAIAIATVSSSRSFLVRGDTEIETSVEVVIQRIIKDYHPPALRAGAVFTFRAGGGEIAFGQARIRTKGYEPFQPGTRYVFAFMKAYVNRPPILSDWIPIDSDDRLTRSAPDRRKGYSSNFDGLPIDTLVDELLKVRK